MVLKSLSIKLEEGRNASASCMSLHRAVTSAATSPTRLMPTASETEAASVCSSKWHEHAWAGSYHITAKLMTTRAKRKNHSITTRTQLKNPNWTRSVKTSHLVPYGAIWCHPLRPLWWLRLTVWPKLKRHWMPVLQVRCSRCIPHPWCSSHGCISWLRICRRYWKVAGHWHTARCPTVTRWSWLILSRSLQLGAVYNVYS